MSIEFHDLRVDLGGHPVLTGIDLRIRPGRVTALIGPNGSGKSTLLRTVFGARRPTSGRVTVEGTDVAAIPPRKLARTVAVMLQDAPSEFDLTVHETVMVGRAPHQAAFSPERAVDRRAVERALRTVGLEAHAGRLLRQLSGGQRQRAMLARALAQEGRILVLDEPTNHLDITHQLEIMRLVRGLGITVVAALHDLSLAADFCDDVAVLHEGRVRAFGSPGDVLGAPLVREVFGVDPRPSTEDASGHRFLRFRPIAEPAPTRASAHE